LGVKIVTGSLVTEGQTEVLIKAGDHRTPGKTEEKNRTTEETEPSVIQKARIEETGDKVAENNF